MARKLSAAQVEALDEMADAEWMDVTPLVRGLCRRKAPLCFIDVDWEAGDPEHGDKRYIVCLTEDGAKTIARLRDRPIYYSTGSAFTWHPAQVNELPYFESELHEQDKIHETSSRT